MRLLITKQEMKLLQPLRVATSPEIPLTYPVNLAQQDKTSSSNPLAGPVLALEPNRTFFLREHFLPQVDGHNALL